MSLVNRIKELCSKKGMTLIGLEREIGLGRGTIRNWDKNYPSIDKIYKVADYFIVPADYLVNGKSTIYCQECGYKYILPIDLKDHEERHRKVLQAKERFGFFYTYNEREEIKSRRDEILGNPKYTTEEQVKFAEDDMAQYHSRSVETNNYDINHPSFAEYASMLLNQDDWKEALPANIYNILIKKYGKSSGLPNRETDYDNTKHKNTNKHLSSYAILSRKDQNDIAIRLEQLKSDLANQETLMLSGEILDNETRELLKSALEHAVTVSKLKAKNKFNPKKNK